MPVDQLDSRLAAAAPPAPADATTRDLIMLLARDVAATALAEDIGKPARRRRYRHRAAAVGIAVTSVVAVAAAGYVIGAPTGTFGAPGMSENDTTEWLDMSDHSSFDVREALSRLDPDDRELITLTAWDGLTSAQAAVSLGISASTARKLLQRARARLRVAIAPADPADSTMPIAVRSNS